MARLAEEAGFPVGDFPIGCVGIFYTTIDGMFLLIEY